MNAACTDLNFECTRCGGCCQNLRLPLSLAEAIPWLASGQALEVLCEAIPWPGEPALDDFPAQSKRRRSFPAFSGALPIRVIVTLAASFRGGCPNLSDDLRCAVYDSRPDVCRIYPAEINPFVLPQPAAKACPSQAWAADKPPFLRAGVLVDDVTRSLIHRSRRASETDVGGKRRLCDRLGIRAAALSNEGYVVRAPGPDALADALAEIVAGPIVEGEIGASAAAPAWLFVSDRRLTWEALVDIGARAIPEEEAQPRSFEFLSSVKVR